MSELILIVDDNDEEVRYLEELVENCGFQPDRARNWYTALQRLRHNEYHAVFLDLNLGTTPQDGFILMDRMEKENLLVPTQIVSHSADLIGVTAACSRYGFVKRRPIPKKNIFVYREFLLNFIREPGARSTIARGDNVVFIAHGRDHMQRDRVVSIVQGLGLVPVVLERTARQGRTIIELFENHARQAVYAIVVMTGDDIGYLKTDVMGERPRVRQNVVFEMGFFYGRTGRERVLCLLEPGVERPSDIDGIIYQDLTVTDVELERKIMKELQALGIEFRVG